MSEGLQCAYCILSDHISVLPDGRSCQRNPNAYLGASAITLNDPLILKECES